MKVKKDTSFFSFFIEAIKISSKGILPIWSLVAFIWGITSTFMDFSNFSLFYIILLSLSAALSLALLIKAMVDIKRETIEFGFGEDSSFFVMKNDFTVNMERLLSAEENREKDFYFAMGIDRSLDVSISTKKGVFFSVLEFLIQNYGLSSENVQALIDKARENQFPQKNVLDYGDTLVVKIDSENKKGFYLLLVANSEKREEAKISNNMELVKGEDSRIIILRLFEKCESLNCENLVLGAFGTNGLKFPYAVIVTEIINAYAKNRLTLNDSYPKNVYLSVRKEDMTRHHLSHSDIVLYIQRVSRFYAKKQ